MALTARIYSIDAMIAVQVSTDTSRTRVAADPDDSGWPLQIWFYWDEDRLATGQRDFLGIEVGRADLLTDDQLTRIAALDLPRVDVPDRGLRDVSIADVLRQVRDTRMHAGTSAGGR